MKTILRLYLATSKGNDPFLSRELLRFNIKSKFDQHLHAFYFDAPFPLLFKIAHRSLIAQNLYVQIGKAFPATSQTTFSQRLQKIQFKNYLPLKRGLIQNLALKILVRETNYPISDNVMTSLLRNALQKEIINRQYFREVLKGDINRDALPNYYEIREIVERKWEQEDLLIQNKQTLIQDNSSKSKALPTSQLTDFKEKSVEKKKQQANSLENIIPFQPHLTLYVRRNKVRLLLKVNQQEMYKFGWKKKVGWAPIRESIATAIMSQTGLLDSQRQTIIWDPFCGSGTLGLVAAAMYYGAWVRLDSSNFNWQHWPIFRQEYLTDYFAQQKSQRKSALGNLKLIFSDISFQAVNYTLQNFKELAKQLQQFSSSKPAQTKNSSSLIKRIRPTDNWVEMLNGEWAVGCGDFQKLAENVLLQGRKINIITNLPYLQARSAEHMPLSQLQRVYRKFTKMIKTHKDKIDNVFVIIDNSSDHISNPYHFLSASEEKWILISSFESGGLPIGLYAWSGNKLEPKHDDMTELITSLQKQAWALKTLPDQQLSTALSSYRKKLCQIQKKTYYLPRYLIKTKRGWKRTVEKRRVRHLQRAYEVFSKRREKMIAFTEYARKKLEVKMLKRGAIWKARNLKLLNGMPLEKIQKELKQEFEGKIESALKLKLQRQQERREKDKEINANKEQKIKKVAKLRQITHQKRIRHTKSAK